MIEFFSFRRRNFVLVTVLLAVVAAAPVYAQYSYIPLTSFEYGNAPVKISDQLIRSDNGRGFRTYYDLENISDSEINYLHFWLLLYFQNQKKPVLYEYKSSNVIPAKSVRNIFWDEPSSEYGEPVAGVLVPYIVGLSNDTEWSLKEQYAKNGGDPVSLLQGVEPLRAGIGENENISPVNVDTSLYHRTMTAVKISERPIIDGRLDDLVWQQVTFQSDFIQREPLEGEPASERTEVALLYDEGYLYIGARLYDSEPDKIRATEMRRDQFLYSDDNFEMIFDTFNDKRNAIYFVTNPLGIRVDGTVSDEGRITNRDWDGVWETKSSIDEKGWYVEVAIPWQTLRFKEGDGVVWGANFVRKIQRKNEDDYWRLIPRYAGRNGKYRMSEAGEILGFNGLKMGNNIELKPFVTGGIQRDRQTDDLTEQLGDLGLDLKYNLTSTLTADFTYNTDFAQVEADQERVNLTRFSLFFPEKRDFFLEGAETFNFGATTSSNMGGFRPQAGNIQLFHSRRIGISSGDLIPIIGGGKINGKVGKFTVGLLSIQTEEVTSIDDDEEESFTPLTNYSVVRLKRDLFSRSSVGVMFLNKEESGGGYNRSVGFDSNFPVNNNLSFFLVGASSFSPSAPGLSDKLIDNSAANIGFKWQSETWQYDASFLDIEKDFNPEMGFITRTDIRRTQGKVTWSPRPKRWASIRNFRFSTSGEYQTDGGNRMINRMIKADFNISFENTSRFSINAEKGVEFLDIDWEIREGYVIPYGRYENSNARLSYNTNRTKVLSARLNVNGGEYFDGSKVGGSINADLKAFNSLLVNLNYSYNLVKINPGQFHTNSLSTRISYSFSPDLFVKAYMQWYNDTLSPVLEGRDRASGNIILRYIYSPGSDFFLVLNQQSLIGPGGTINQNRVALVKFTYFFRK